MEMDEKEAHILFV